MKFLLFTNIAGQTLIHCLQLYSILLEGADFWAGAHSWAGANSWAGADHTCALRTVKVGVQRIAGLCK